MQKVYDHHDQRPNIELISEMTNANDNNNENLSFEDRKNWFSYHMHNSKVSEEETWKHLNEMIRII